MPRGRMLNKKIVQDEKVAKLSIEATLLYTWCISFLDFRGRIYGDLWSLKAIVPHIKEITPRKIKQIIQEWIDADLVIYYGNEKQKYLEFKGFTKNQTLREGREAESEIPAPTPTELQRNSSETPAKEKLSKEKLSKEKIRHLDFVLLTKKEHQTLCNLFGESQAKDMIEKLNNYIGSKGKQYKSHYFTILNWAGKDGIRKQTITKKPEFMKDFKEPNLEEQKKVQELVKTVTEKRRD